MEINKLSDLNDVDVSNLEEIIINLTDDCTSNFLAIIQKIFYNIQITGPEQYYKHYRNFYRFDNIQVKLYYSELTIGKGKPFKIGDQKSLTLPIKKIHKKLLDAKNRETNDKNLENVYDFEYSLMKPLIEQELSEHGIRISSEGYLTVVQIKYSPRLARSTLKRDLRVNHEIGDSFPLSLSFAGDTGYVSFKSISWSKAKAIILALNS